jgi:hypothetical protein
MKRLLFGLVLLGGLGCTGVQPVGPLAKSFDPGAPKAEPGAAADNDSKTEPPVASAASRPVPPARLIEPDEVTADTAAVAAQKLLNEYEADRRTMPAPPKTAEVSVYKKGEKVR